MRFPRVERTHRILGLGWFEERVTIDGVLVDVLDFYFDDFMVTHRTPLKMIRGVR